MMAIEAALSFAWRHWKLILGAAVALGLSLALLIARSDARHWHKSFDTEKTLHALDVANFKAASAKAIADNLADVRAKEGDAAIITEKANHDLESQLADARRLATDYARRMRAASAANPGSAGQAAFGQAASTASPFGSAGGVPLLDEDDVRICTDATVKALGWPAFYASLRTRYNTDGAP